jgi:hypothetical protein
MKYWTTAFLATIIFCTSCKKEEVVEPEPEPQYLEDNIFGCDQFEVMETENRFSSNREPNLEVLNDFFVYGGPGFLVVKEGFNGPTLQTREMVVVGIERFNNQLMICAEEGLYSLKTSGEIEAITTDRCYSITVDGQNRLMAQGVFGNPNLATSYYIHEFKNNTLVPFTPYPSSFDCISMELIGGRGPSLYSMSCNDRLAHYRNGVIQAAFNLEEAPLFAGNGIPKLYDYYDGSMVVITHDRFPPAFRMYKLAGQGWVPIYDLTADSPDDEKNQEIFVFNDYNTLIHNGYLYTFRTSGDQSIQALTRFDISGDGQKGWKDIELVSIPGLESRDIIDIVFASDGHAYAVLNSRKIVRISC